MARKKYTIGTETFDTKDEALSFCSRILNRYGIDERVSDEDALHVSALLEMHPDAERKAGVGVSHFLVIRNPKYSHRKCFYVVRTDSTGTDFGIGNCVSGRPSHKSQCLSAFRWAVAPFMGEEKERHIMERRVAEGSVRCALTGEVIRDEDTHLDHTPPLTFERVVANFLVSQGIGFADVALVTGIDGQVGPTLADEELRKSFFSYHGKNAILRLIKKTENLAQSSRHRMRDTP